MRGTVLDTQHREMLKKPILSLKSLSKNTNQCVPVMCVTRREWRNGKRKAGMVEDELETEKM